MTKRTIIRCDGEDCQKTTRPSAFETVDWTLLVKKEKGQMVEKHYCPECRQSQIEESARESVREAFEENDK